ARGRAPCAGTGARPSGPTARTAGTTGTRRPARRATGAARAGTRRARRGASATDGCARGAPPIRASDRRLLLRRGVALQLPCEHRRLPDQAAEGDAVLRRARVLDVHAVARTR